MSKKLLVEFPGRNYSCDKPLLYYGGKVFEKKGYDVVRLSYNNYLKGYRVLELLRLAETCNR